MTPEENFFDKKTNRRSFLMKALWGTGGLVGLLVSIPVIGALLSPLFRYTPAEWRKVGKVSDFQTWRL